MLELYWNDWHFSASQIGHFIGATRSAVIGKARRMGLDRRVTSPTRYKSSLPKKARARPKLARPKLVQKLFVEPPRPAPILEPSEPVHLLDLKPHHCRWMDGESSTLMFCGRTKYDGKPYCLEHCRRAYK